MSRLLALGLLVVALGAAGPAADPPRRPAGTLAPDTTLPDQHGRAVRLADLLARRDFVVVAFYVKAFTGG